MWIGAQSASRICTSREINTCYCEEVFTLYLHPGSYTGMAVCLITKCYQSTWNPFHRISAVKWTSPHQGWYSFPLAPVSLNYPRIYFINSYVLLIMSTTRSYFEWVGHLLPIWNDHTVPYPYITMAATARHPITPQQNQLFYYRNYTQSKLHILEKKVP